MTYTTDHGYLARMRKSCIAGNWDGATIDELAAEFFNCQAAEVDSEGDVWRNGAWADPWTVSEFANWLRDRNIDVTPWSIGDRVEGGETADDYDTGRVVDVDGESITVAWDSGIRTTQDASIMRPQGQRVIE